jgi:hypothetical protein
MFRDFRREQAKRGITCSEIDIQLTYIQNRTRDYGLGVQDFTNQKEFIWKCCLKEPPHSENLISITSQICGGPALFVRNV